MSNKKRRNKQREKKISLLIRNRKNKQRKKKIQSLDTGHRPVSNHSNIEYLRPQLDRIRNYHYNNELMYGYDSEDSEDHLEDSEDSEPEADIEMMSKTAQETQQICDSLVLEYLHENELYDTAAFLEEKRENFYTLKLKKEDEISEPLSMIIENFKPQPRSTVIGGIVLPEKCLIQILSYLDFKTVQKVCTQVSKSWLELIRYNETGPAFVKCLKTHKSLEKIVISCQIDLYEDGRSLRWV